MTGVQTCALPIFIILLVVTGCKGVEAPPLQVNTIITEDINGIDLNKLNHYTINVFFNPGEATLRANQKIDYINNEETTLEEIYLHLYPNSYREANTAPFLFDSFNEAYPNGFQPGYIDVNHLSLNGNDAEYQLEGHGQTIMKISLANPLKPGEWSTIQMEYTLTLPPTQERFGYGEDTFNFGNWYPVAAVFDETGWNLDPYYPIGDPFYSDA